MNIAELFKKNFIFIPVVASIVVGGFTSVKYVLNLTQLLLLIKQQLPKNQILQELQKEI